MNIHKEHARARVCTHIHTRRKKTRHECDEKSMNIHIIYILKTCKSVLYTYIHKTRKGYTCEAYGAHGMRVHARPWVCIMYMRPSARAYLYIYVYIHR